MALQTISEQRCYGGVQGFYEHASDETGTNMRIAVFQPPQATSGPVPVLYYLAGLTCTEETATTKAGAQAHAAQHGLMLVMPDTSPRGLGIEGEDDDWDFGTGAGFYLDATNPPWAANYRMYSYVTRELRTLIEQTFPARSGANGIFGHSMGGHGALTIGLKNADVYSSVSAFAPICAPLHCPWGEKALSNYLGADRANWSAYDACELVRANPTDQILLVDQGLDDQFLAEQLKPELLEAACKEAGQPLALRRHEGYDHSYYFIQSFMGDHITHHAGVLNAR
jgi:S-formylglutathione hydrolase